MSQADPLLLEPCSASTMDQEWGQGHNIIPVHQPRGLHSLTSTVDCLTHPRPNQNSSQPQKGNSKSLGFCASADFPVAKIPWWLLTPVPTAREQRQELLGCHILQDKTPVHWEQPPGIISCCSCSVPSPGHSIHSLGFKSQQS